MAGSGCAHTNAGPRRSAAGGSADIVCPDCKLSVSARQIDLAWTWMKKAKKRGEGPWRSGS